MNVRAWPAGSVQSSPPTCRPSRAGLNTALILPLVPLRRVRCPRTVGAIVVGAGAPGAWWPDRYRSIRTVGCCSWRRDPPPARRMEPWCLAARSRILTTTVECTRSQYSACTQSRGGNYAGKANRMTRTLHRTTHHDGNHVMPIDGKWRHGGTDLLTGVDPWDGTVVDELQLACSATEKMAELRRPNRSPVGGDDARVAGFRDTSGCRTTRAAS